MEWEKLGTFVQNIGIPAAALFLLMFGLFRLVRPWVAKRIEREERELVAREKFISAAEEGQRVNAETNNTNAATLSQLAGTIEKKHIDHVETHNKLDDIKQAAIAYLEGMKKQVRLMSEGQNIEAVLADFESAERALRR
jgi:hypothetical protein